jgi:alpha-tubulin suppressor-like RCC1 family protein
MPYSYLRVASFSLAVTLVLVACSSSTKKKVEVPFGEAGEDAGGQAGETSTAGGAALSGNGGSSAAPNGGDAGAESGGADTGGVSGGGMSSGGTAAGGMSAGGAGGACNGPSQHSPCVTGAALDPTCDTCAQFLCQPGFETYCCTHAWDMNCVEYAYMNCSNTTSTCPGGFVEAKGPLPASNVKVKHVQLGFNGSCAIDENDELWCWGNNSKTAVLDGSTEDPVYFPRKTGLTGIKEVAVWQTNICALDMAGNMSCWGSLGQTTPTQLLTSVQHLGGGATNTMCALKTDGSVWCWGVLGAGTGPASAGAGALTVPTQVTLPGMATQIADGEFASCAIMSTGIVRCWGSGGIGTGNWNPAPPTTTSNCLPSAWNATAGNDCNAALGGVTALAVSGGHTCAVGAAGVVTCVGSDTFGELDGIKTAGSRVLSPALPAAATQLAESDLSSDDRFGGPATCALLTTGDVYCWGYDATGSLGGADSFTHNGVTVPPTKVAGLSNVVQLDYAEAAGSGAAITQSGVMYAWGREQSNARSGVGAMSRVGIPLTAVPFIAP